jgi:O-antigen ligase
LYVIFQSLTDDLLLTGSQLEGILTVLISFTAYFFIQNYPDTATFLTDRERAFIQARLAADSDANRNETFSWANVVNAIKDHKAWLYGLAFRKFDSIGLHNT